jgi:hypothetical protein
VRESIQRRLALLPVEYLNLCYCIVDPAAEELEPAPYFDHYDIIDIFTLH